jgi:regulator of sigma E protease
VSLRRSPRRRAALVLCAAIPAFLLAPPAVSLTDLPNTILNILYVAFGLGMVIFLHELGHFGMAKACDVFVERFSIGFPPTIWSRKWGETEYALGAIPFGGYVKMLGQDDMDPSQLTSEEIAQDPRSYSAKPVWQRMAIISAGVTMNVLTAVLFFAAAYGLGLQVHEPVAGGVVAGGPAWRAGLRTGDVVEKVNGRETHDFLDIIRGVALSNKPIRLEGKRADGTPFDVEVTPDLKGTRREIGMETAFAAEIGELEGNAPPVMPGTPAAKADPPLKPGDRIVAIDGQPVRSYADMLDLFARRRAEEITLDVRRGGGHGQRAERVEVKIGPNKARSFGARVEFNEIVAVVEGSPAERAGIKPGDRITKVDGKDVGAQIDPLRLPYLLGDSAGQTVALEILREESGAQQTRAVQIVPEDRPGWAEQPSHPGEPLSIPSIGVAFHLTPRVLNIAEGGPAAKAGLQFGDIVTKVAFVLPKSAKPEPGRDGKPIEIDMEETTEGASLRNFAFAFATMQRLPQRTVRLTFTRPGKDKPLTAELTPWSAPDDSWYVPTRGFFPDPLTGTLKAKSVGQALALGYDSTKNSVVELYLTLRNLITLDLSFKELRGPLGIAEIAYKVADQGFAELLKFLGFLSVNLAVLNFLPIPVLDGGHMVFLVWEAVTRRRPSERVVVAATYLGMFFILGLMGTVIYLDLFVHKVFRGEG